LFKSNPKKFWKYVKSKSTTNPGIGDLQLTDKDVKKVISDDLGKAKVLSDYFSSVFMHEPPTDNLTCENNYMSCDMSEFCTSEKDILEKLNHINVNKSPGPDLIHPRILFEARHQIAYPLHLLFETSLHLQQLPFDWKSANISAIYKKDSKSGPCNYRPISLTSTACKVMKSLLRDHLINHFIKNNYFSNKQYGFIKGRSTVTQLLNIMDKRTEYLEIGGQVGVTFSKI